MSEQEREIEVVAGVIEGVIQKKPDTWQVEVRPDGSQYTKKLWTKDAELVAAMGAKFGQAGAFVCSASYWQGPNGQVRSLWINSLADPEDVTYTPATAPRSTPEAAVALARVEASQKPQKASGEMSKEEWARKDSAIHKMACIKTAADALKHTIPTAVTEDGLKWFNSNVMFLASAWHRSVLAERDDPTGEDVPF